MAGSTLPLEQLIKSCYGIQVAARCSSDVEDICKKNRLSFCELLRPFSQLLSESSLRDHQGHLYTVRDVCLRFSEPCSEYPSSTEIDQILHNTVSWSEANLLDDTSKSSMMTIGNVEAPACTPWFNHYCEAFMDNINVMEHETARHFTAVVLVVSSRLHHPVESIQKLYKLQKESEQHPRCPYWIPSPHIFYYHVLVHDVFDGSHKHARECYDVLKSTYGSGSCYFLPINSLDPSSKPDDRIPEPWTSCLHIMNDGESTDFGFPKFKRKKVKSSSPQTSSKVVTKSSPSTGTHQSKNDKLTEETNVQPTPDDEGPQHSSSSSVSVISSQIELGADPLSGSDSGNLDVDEMSDQRRVGCCMSLEDQNNLRAFVKEFSGRLLTHLGAVLTKLNESLQSKRTVSRRMSSFSRGFIWKMMGGSTSTGTNVATSGNGATGNEDNQSLLVDSIEWHMRVVGDLAFLIHNYELAYNMHHTLKRDLQGRDLWIHYAGAHEMAALSALMMGSSRKEIQSYLEEATNIYNSQLQLSMFGLRASMFLCEILKSKGKFKELVSLLVVPISVESDLRSALWLEQLAHAYLKHTPIPMVRKFALHMVLAANHFSKAGLKTHAVRCYQLALPPYENNGWIIAENFLQYIIAKLCFTLDKPHQTLNSLERILSHDDNKQPIQQQLNSLTDYIHMRKALLNELNEEQLEISYQEPYSMNDSLFKNIPRLPIPILSAQKTSVIFDNGVSDPCKWLSNEEPSSLNIKDDNESPHSNHFSTVSDNRLLHSSGVVIGVNPYDPEIWSVEESEWNALEDCVVSNEKKKMCVPFMRDGQNNSTIPICSINELIKVEITLKNPLSIGVHLKSSSLTWSLEGPDDNREMAAAADSSCILCEVIERIDISPNTELKVPFRVVPKRLGTLIIRGLVFSLFSDDNHRLDHHEECLQGRIDINCQGVRLNQTKLEKAGLIYGKDYRLHWNVINPIPRAMMTIEGFREPTIAGQLVQLIFKVVNCGSVPLSQVIFCSTLYPYTLLLSDNEISLESDIYGHSKQHQSNDFKCIKSLVASSSVLSKSIKLPLQSGPLLPGDSHSYTLLMHVPFQPCLPVIPWSMVLFYQQRSDIDDEQSYRLSRHFQEVSVKNYVRLQALVVPSFTLNNDGICTSSLLSLTVSNNPDGINGGPKNMSIQQVSMISKHWKILERTSTLDDPIQSSKSAVVNITINRLDHQLSDHDVCFSDLSLTENSNGVICSGKSPVCDLLISSLSHDSTGGGFPECLSSSVIVVVFWKADFNETPSMYGYQYIVAPLPEFACLKSLNDSSPISQYDIVKYTIQSPASIEHDFKQDRICSVPIQFVLENCSNKDVNVVIELLPTTEATIGIRALEPPFFWYGSVKRHLHLKALSRHDENLLARFTKCGIYNLNAFRIKACYANDKQNTMYNQRWQFTSYVSIISKQ